jgi:hypothetical protein
LTLPASAASESRTREHVRRRAGAMLRPPPQLTVSEWAEQHRILGSRASSEPGPWRTASSQNFAPLRCFSLRFALPLGKPSKPRENLRGTPNLSDRSLLRLSSDHCEAVSFNPQNPASQAFEPLVQTFHLRYFRGEPRFPSDESCRNARHAAAAQGWQRTPRSCGAQGARKGR